MTKKENEELNDFAAKPGDFDYEDGKEDGAFQTFCCQDEYKQSEEVGEMSTEFGVTIVPGTISLESTKDQLRSFVETVKASYISQPITADNLVSAKKDLANVRKIGKQVTAKMASVKKELLAPFDALNTEIKAILSGLDEIETEMDEGIKAVIQARQEKKHADVVKLLEDRLSQMKPEVAELIKDYYSPRWDLVSTSAADITTDIQSLADNANAVMSAVRGNPHEAQLLGVFRQCRQFTPVQQAMERFRLEDEKMAELQRIRALMEAEEADRKTAEEDSRAQQKEPEAEITQPEPETPLQPQEPAREEARTVIIAQFSIQGEVTAISEVIRYAGDLGVIIKRTGEARRA
ncbi:MAG: DUF1351 domain-containing protein [Candidatus Cloacimonetes bacterium]|nr:DUF1351 domain-containing protein [Candidatus Cloacimonadota bacterium]